MIDLDWEQNVKGVRFQHRIFFGTEPVSTLDRREIYMRALCHVMVNAIPEQGLSSLADSVAELYQFYVVEMPHVVASQLPSKGRVTRGRVVRRAERSPLELPEG